jgi:hypothetical protein
MAKEENQSVLGDFKGQIGDKVISKRGRTKYIKQKGKKKNHHTKPKQKTERRLGDVSKIWTSLTIAERRTWFMLLQGSDVFKNTDNKKITEARYLFISINRNLIEIGEPIKLRAPVYAYPQLMFLAKFEMVLKGKKLYIQVHLLNKIEEDTKVIVQATPSLINPSESVNPRLYRSITVLDSKFKSGSSIKKEYLKVFGKIGGVGEEFSFRYITVNKNSGVKGYPLSCRTAIINPKKP